MKELKQSQLNEHANRLKDIEDERLKLQEDKARMDIEMKLHSRISESEISRAEIDVSVKYAEVNKKFMQRQRSRKRRKKKSKCRILFKNADLSSLSAVLIKIFFLFSSCLECCQRIRQTKGTVD